MENHKINDDSGFGSEKINDLSELKDSNHYNFMSGLENARNLLSGLERSIRKTDSYERRLLKCKTSHPHSHEANAERSKVKKDKHESPGRPKNPNDSRATMSFVCLQYQYDELAKRYESLLHDRSELCDILHQRDEQLTRLETRVKAMRDELTNAHEVVLIVGEKCLALTRKKQVQKKNYNAQIEQLRAMLRSVLHAAERARCELDSLDYDQRVQPHYCSK